MGWIVWWLMSTSLELENRTGRACADAKATITAMRDTDLGLLERDARKLERMNVLAIQNITLCQSVIERSGGSPLSTKNLYMLGAAVHGAADQIAAIADVLASDRATNKQRALEWMRATEAPMKELEMTDLSIVERLMAELERCQ